MSDFVMSNFSISGIASADSLFLNVTSSLASFVLGCVYRAPSNDFHSDVKLFSTLTNIANDYANLVIFGDLNMPDLKWPLSSPVAPNQSAHY